eukprot:TRINITY_DN701_c0_g2_i1.p1 TRINITY_DN701_c0_g2~~TRINITY_DN701_c0_g2_i1.p1  ORF type:complete len:599 (+),score=155.19 TRINITY_DN701_c0_g2_i1:533-2329(+)
MMTVTPCFPANAADVRLYSWHSASDKPLPYMLKFPFLMPNLTLTLGDAQFMVTVARIPRFFGLCFWVWYGVGVVLAQQLKFLSLSSDDPQFMVTVARVPRYTARPEHTIFIVTSHMVQRVDVRLPRMLKSTSLTLTIVLTLNSTLADAQFMVTVARIPRYTARLECTLFIRAFAEDAAFLKGRVTMVRTAVTEVVDSEKLRKLLVMVMNMGNFLNEGTRQGNARGFKMASLLKLETVKTLDRTKTSLHVLAEWGKKSMPEVLKLEDDLQHCKEASSWSLTDLHSEIAAMRKGLTQVQAQLAASENQKDKPPQDRFAETAAAFLRTAVSRMHELEDLLQKTTAAYREAAQLFGEDPGTVPSGEFFALMTEFVTMLGRAVKENHQREVLEEKRRRSEEKAAKAAKLKQAKLEKQQREGTDKGIGAFQRMPSRAPSGRLMQARAKSGIIPMAADTSDHVPPTVLNDKFNRIKEERAIEGAILRPQLQAQLRSGRSMIVRERMPSRRATASTKFMDGGTSSTSLARFDSHANISSSSGARERMAAQRMRTQRLSHAAATQSGLRAPSHPSPFRPQAVRAGSTVPANMRSSFKRLRSTTFIGR